MSAADHPTGLDPRVVRALDAVGAACLAAYVAWTLAAHPWVEPVGCLRSASDALRRGMIVAELGIFVPYTWMPVRLALIWRRLRVRPEARLFVLYGAFIVLCGLTHLLGALSIPWTLTGDVGPSRLYWLSLKMKALTAAVSVAVARTTDKREADILKLGERAAADALALVSEREARAALVAKCEELRAMVEERDAKAALVARQAETIQHLQIPLIQLTRTSVIVPLVGIFDSERAASLTEALLSAIDAGRADAALVDMTGVEHIDTATAANVVALTKSAKWMGATVVITGVRPAVANTLTSLNVDLGVRPYRTIEKGLAALEALGRRGPGPERPRLEGQ